MPSRAAGSPGGRGHIRTGVVYSVGEEKEGARGWPQEVG